MEKGIKIAWSAPKDPEFDLREFALGVLNVAKENLLQDGELIGTAFVISNDSIQCASMEFGDHDEKARLYDALVQYARGLDAIALVTCSDAYMRDKFGPDDVAAYYPGKLAVEGARECIILTVSGPGIRTWSLEVPYQRTTAEIRFGQLVEEFGGELGLLEGWASQESKIQ